MKGSVVWDDRAIWPSLRKHKGNFPKETAALEAAKMCHTTEVTSFTASSYNPQ